MDMKKEIQVVDEIETVKALLNGYSIARYGDGELQLIFAGGIEYIIQTIKGHRPKIFGNGGLWFSYRLRKILVSNQKNLLVGIPNIFYDGADEKWRSKYFYENKEKIISLLDSDKLYYSSFFTRFNHRTVNCEYHWDRLKKIWERKNIGIVNFNSDIVNNEMFENARKITFILCQRRNAWGYGLRYYALLNRCKKVDCDLILAISGPVATLLADDLSKVGKQCIDIGQLIRMKTRMEGCVDENLY